MRLRFTKMHGLGNDFVMLDGVSQRLNVSSDMIQRLADRHFGIGCDQVLIVEPPRKPEADFCYRIFNQDGSEVENCGNGARCFAVFVRMRGLTQKTTIYVQTAGGDLVLKVLDNNEIEVNMGIPELAPEKIPFEAAEQSAIYSIDVNEQSLDISAISMGNPHAVTVVKSAENFPVEALGPLIENHPRFPNKVNAGFLEITNKSEGRLRVHERGVGETLACGTGACAAMVAGKLQGLFDNQVALRLNGGTLNLTWEGPGKPVIMTGPAVAVFTGQIKL